MPADPPPIGRVEYIQTFLPTGSHIRGSSVKVIEDVNDLLDIKLGVTDWGRSCGTCNSFLEQCPGHNGHLELPIPVYRVFFTRRLLTLLNSICFYCQMPRVSETSTVYQQAITLEVKDRLPFVCKHSCKEKICIQAYCQRPHVTFTFRSRDAAELQATVPLTLDDYEAYATHGMQPKRISPSDVLQCLQSIPPTTKTLLGCTQWNEPSALMWDVLPIPSINTRPCHSFEGMGGGNKQMQYNDWTKILRMIVSTRNDLRAAVASSADTVNLATYVYAGHTSSDAVAALTKRSTTLGTTGAVTGLWRQLNQYIAAFHSYRHKKYINKNGVFSRPLCNIEDRYKYQKSGRFRGNIIARRINNAMRGVLEGDIYLRPDQVGIPRKEAMNLCRKIRVNLLNRHVVAAWIARGPLNYPGANYIVMKDGSEVDLQHHHNRRVIPVEDVLYVHRHLVDGDMVMVNRQPTLHKPSMMSFSVVVIDGFAIRLHYSVFTPMAADCDGDEVNVYIPQTIESIAEVSTLSRVQDCVMKDGVVWIKFIQNAIVGAFLLTRRCTRLTEEEVHDMVSFLDIWEYPTPVCSSPEKRWSGRQMLELILPADFCLHLPRGDGREDVVVENGCLLSGQLDASALNGVGGLLEHMYRDYPDSGVVIRFLHHGYLLFQRYIDMHGLTAGYDDCAVNDARVEEELETSRQQMRTLATQIDHRTTWDEEAMDTSLKEHTEFIVSRARETVLSYHRRRDDGIDRNGVLQLIQSGTKGSDNTLNQMCGVVGQIYVLYKRYAATTSHTRQSRASGGALFARGMIPYAYSTGIDLTGVVAEAHAACESVLSKNRGTAKSGYTMRKLTTCMMGVVVNYKDEVVDTRGRVIWKTYGGDGYDPARLASMPVTLTTLSSDVIRRTYGGTGVYAEECERILRARTSYTQNRAENSAACTGGDPLCKTPVHFAHLLLRCRVQFGTSGSCTPTECSAVVQSLWDHLVHERLVQPDHLLFRLLWLEWMSTHNLVRTQSLTSDGLVWVGREITRTMVAVKVVPGESVGVNATQCLGEPFTQMSLKTPHLSGKFSIVSGSARIANLVDGMYPDPTMHVVLQESVQDRRAATMVGVSLIRTCVRDIANEYPRYTHCGDEYTIRLRLDRSLSIQRMVTPRHVASRIAERCGLSVSSMRASFADDLLWSVDMCVTPESPAWKILDTDDRRTAVACLIWNIWNGTIVAGSPHIHNFIADQIQIPTADGGTSTRWALTMLGSDLPYILARPAVDTIRTTSSDCAEVGRIFGIHASRRVLEEEFTTLMGGRADERHIQLIARMMASNLQLKGMKIKQLGRNIPPLQRAAYEQSAQQMSEYCAIAERDYGETICGAALTNRPMKVGSGFNLELLPAPDPTAPGVDPVPVPVGTYVVSPKVDGVRALVTFATANKRKICNLMDRNGTLWSLPTTGVPDTRLFAGTVLDGDVVRDRSGVVHFVVYDCLLSCGHRLSSLRYDKRLEIAREQVYRLGLRQNVFAPGTDTTPVQMFVEDGLPTRRPVVSTQSFQPGMLPFRVCVKPIFDIHRLTTFDSTSFHFPTDGYVFTNLTDPATPFRRSTTAILKWKPSTDEWDENSIDVYTRLAPVHRRVLDEPDDLRPVCYRAYRRCEGVYEMETRHGVLVSYGEGSPPGGYEGDGVYEYRWNRLRSAWCMFRRRDKSANTLQTVTATLRNIIERVSLHDIASRLH